MEAIIVAIISTLGVIVTTVIQTYNARKKDNIELKLDNLKKQFEEQIQEIKKDTRNVELQNCINFLVDTIATAKKDGYLDESVKIRFHENFDVYTNKYHKNSYIHEEVEKLVKEGVL